MESLNYVVRLHSLADLVCKPTTTPEKLKSFIEDNVSTPPVPYKDGLDAILIWICRRGWMDLAEWALQTWNKTSGLDSLIRYQLEEKGVNYISYQLTPYCLINKRKLVKCQDVRSDMLIHAAARGSSKEVVASLLAAGSPADAVNCCKQTPLMIASIVCDFDICALLIEQGVGLDSQDSSGYTPLMYACTARKLGRASSKVVSLLLQSGASVQICNNVGYTALHVAVSCRNAFALETLLSHQLPLDSHGGSSSLWYCSHHLFEQLCDGVYTPICQVVTSSSQCSTVQKAEMFLLLATFVFESSSATSQLDACKRILKKAYDISSDFLHSQYQLAMDSIYQPHLNLIGCLSDLNQLPQPQAYVTIAYLCLAVRENILSSCLSTAVLLFKVGKRLLYHNPTNFHQTLLLWSRASSMLKSFIDRIGCGTDSPTASSLLYILRGPMMFMVRKMHLQISQTQHLMKQSTMILHNVFDSTLHYLSSVCCSHSHTQNFRVVSQSSLVEECVIILHHVWKHSNNKCSPVESVNNLGQVLVRNCPTFLYRDLWPSNILAFCTKAVSLPVEFMENLLEWGATKYLNVPVGIQQNRPLHCCCDAKLISLLLDYGAHFDAVNLIGKSASEYCSGQSESILSCFSRFKVTPLVCLSAIAVLNHRLEYKESPHIPTSLKVLIRFHDNTAL